MRLSNAVEEDVDGLGILFENLGGRVITSFVNRLNLFLPVSTAVVENLLKVKISSSVSGEAQNPLMARPVRSSLASKSAYANSAHDIVLVDLKHSKQNKNATFSLDKYYKLPLLVWGMN